MGDKIRIAANPNEVAVVCGRDYLGHHPQFTVRIRTSKNAYINAPVSLADIKPLNVWLAKRIAEAEEPKDEGSENQLDMFEF